MNSSRDPLLQIRAALMELPATGARGFEGLVATALADLTGMTFRLAKSGLQFGRDASTPRSDLFGIALECKQYRSNMRLEDLAGKAVLAGAYLEGTTDVWVVGATSELGDDIESQLSAILEDRGISLLVLDWSPSPLPPLAVLFAATANATLNWFIQHHSAAGTAGLRRALRAVAREIAFPVQADALRASVERSKVGLECLRRRGEVWLRARLADASLSQVTFGQRILTNRRGARPLPREDLVEELDQLLVPDKTELSVTAIIGGEGTGKTWLAAQWWSSREDSPIFVIVAGRRTDLLIGGNAIMDLARLLADQDGRLDETHVAGWVRRLHRWRSAPPPKTPRFVVLLDGLNEHAAIPWPTYILDFALLLRDLGGRLVVTSREAFWKRDILSRLSAAISVQTYSVGGYSDRELDVVLAPTGFSASALPLRVKRFIANPRVCSVAIDLLGRMLLPGELSVERLLLEYWRARLEERGAGLAHNVEDFHRLLRNHARAWRDRPRAGFDRDEWASHSGPARRLGPQDVINDLTEIEEGRFMEVSPGDLGAYTFRADALPFALGLLITDELRWGLAAGGRADVDDLLERMIEPVRGFDQIGGVLAAATILAGQEEAFPRIGLDALIVAWLGLQNHDGDSIEAMGAAIAARPDAFLDLAEQPAGPLDGGVTEGMLTILLQQVRDLPKVHDALGRRLPRWLGSWSRASRPLWRDERTEERQAQRTARISANLAELNPQDRALLEAYGHELRGSPQALLDRLAARLMAGRPLAPLASGIVGWGLVGPIGGDLPDGRPDLQWAIRLNPVDGQATRDAVAALLTGIDQASSSNLRAGAAEALRLLGDQPSAERAERLAPDRPRKMMRRVEAYCDTDPYDPGAPHPSNLDKARDTIRRLEPAALWLEMSASTEEMELDWASRGLVRFDSDLLVERLNTFVQTATNRTGLPLRQLSWRLPELSPILTEASKAVIREAFRLSIAEPDRLAAEDRGWVPAQFATSLIASASPAEQLQIIQDLPPGSRFYLSFQQGLMPLDAAQFEVAIGSAYAQGATSQALRRVLGFAGGVGLELTQVSRRILCDTIFDADRHLAAIAADAAILSGDRTLFHDILEGIADRSEALPTGEFSVGRVIAEAIVVLERDDLIDHAPPQFLGWITARRGRPALTHFASLFEATLERLCAPVEAEPPEDTKLVYVSSADDRQATIWCEEIEEGLGGPNDLMSKFDELSNAEASAQKYAMRQRFMIDQMKAYREALSREQASALSSPPPREALEAIADLRPELVEDWLARVMAALDQPWRKTQLRDLGLALASAHARNNGAQAAEAFAVLREVRAVTHFLIGETRTPLFLERLFAAGPAPELHELQAQTLDQAYEDPEIATAVIAAERAGMTDWLDAYVEARVSSSEPAPIARALTVAGLRSRNPQSEELLSRDWSTGFLGEAARAARAAYERAVWCEHWLAEAKTATTAQQFWRAGRLMEGIADTRILATLERQPLTTELGLRYGPGLLARLHKAADKRAKARHTNFCGILSPSDEVLWALHS